MTDMDDMTLLRAYLKEGSEEAFAALVSRYLNLVYCAALRRVRDPQVAEDISQVVFIILARKAASLRRETILSTWLYRTTCFATADAVKSQARRRQHEQETAMAPNTDPEANQTDWQSIAPVLDDAIGALGAKDRNAIILRFFENKSFRQIGVALDLNEDSARMRVSRAVEKLRSLLVQKKVAVGTGKLADLLAAHSVTAAAPAALAATITKATVVKGAAAGGPVLTSLKGTLKLMAWTKIKTAAITGALALLAVTTVWQKYEIHRAGHGLVTLHVVNAPLGEVMQKIERQSGQPIAWERRLDTLVTLSVQNMPLPQVLNQLILQIGAYWTVDYAVFDSKTALHNLETALQSETSLRDAGWTTLSRGWFGFFQINVKSARPAGMGRGGMATSSGSGRVAPGRGLARVTVAVPYQTFVADNPADTQALFDANSMSNGPDKMQTIAAAMKALSEARLKRGDPREVVNQALRDGTNEGVLVPERTLAEIQLLPRIDDPIPVAATPDEADLLAKKARASWATIYTLRRSPVAPIGVSLVHQGEPVPPSPFPGRSTNAAERLRQLAEQMQQQETDHLTLTPEQRALHAQTLGNLKQNH
jgi:RNA polymerase sigma factor (sigma-70 family)